MPNTEQRADVSVVEQWQTLVQRLHADLDAVVADFMTRVRRIPPYGRNVVPIERVEDDALLSFDYLLRRLGGLPMASGLREVGGDIGRDRARRLVPLEHLQDAVRLDFQVLWSLLRSRAPAADLPILVEHVDQIWSVVEEYTSQVQLAYLAETALMARERGRERSVLVARLLDSPDVDAAEVERVAIALGVDVGATFLLASVHNSRQAGLYRAYEHALAEGRPAHWQERGNLGLLLLEWRGTDERAVGNVLGQVACGVGPLARGLHAVPRAAYVAQSIAEVLGPEDETPLRVRDVLGKLLATSLGGMRPDIAQMVLGRLGEVPQREQDRLLETVRHYLAAGTVHETARRLYCHRNTVLNRLQRFAALTDYDVTVPAEAVAVLVALDCDGLEARR